MQFHRFVLGLLFCSCIFANAAQSGEKPNIVMIFADDLGWGDVGFNGRKTWKTPNLDHLAKQGTVFKRWYTGAVVCAPSRAVLMTGKYTVRNGVSGNSQDLPSEEVTIAEALKKQGYRTALFGKWHGGKPRDGNKTSVHPMDHGFDEFLGFTSAVHAWEHFPKELWFEREMKPLASNVYTATLFTDQSLAFLERNTRNPFFLYLALTEPHLHIEAPAEDVARFKGKFPEKDSKHTYNANYAAMISRMDNEIGRLIEKLDHLGLSENTLVVFTSDHGATFEVRNQGTANFHDSNAPFRGHKRTLWEGGIRVPAIVRWPGKVPARKISQEVVHTMDLFPTFLAAAGDKPDPAWKIDGVDLLQLWLGKGTVPERTLFWEWRAEGNYQLAAMRGNLKLISTGNNQPEMFDVVNDPAERRSVVAEHSKLAKELQEGLNAWLATEMRKAK